MTIYLLKGYLDRWATSAADAASLLTALADQTDEDNLETIARIEAKHESLVQADTGEPITLGGIDDTAGTVSIWVTDASTSITLALGDPDTNGNAIYASTTVDTIGASTRTGTLNLNTSAMADAVNRGRRGPFTVQIRKTTAGVTETLGLLSVPVAESVVNATPTTLDPTTYLTSAAAFAAFLPRAQGFNAQTVAAAGNIAVAFANANVAVHTEIITITGAAGNYNPVFGTTARSNGDVILAQVNLPATANLYLNFYSGAAASPFFTLGPTDSTGTDLAGIFYYQGAWKRLLTVAA